MGPIEGLWWAVMLYPASIYCALPTGTGKDSSGPITAGMGPALLSGRYLMDSQGRNATVFVHRGPHRAGVPEVREQPAHPRAHPRGQLRSQGFAREQAKVKA